MLKTSAKWIPLKKLTFTDEALSHADTGMAGHHHKGDVWEPQTTEILDGEKTVAYSYRVDPVQGFSVRKTTTITQNGKSTKKSITYRSLDPTKFDFT